MRGLIPFSGVETVSHAWVPKEGELIPTTWIQPQVPVTVFRQWCPGTGTQVKASLVTPFIPRMPTSMQLSTAHRTQGSQSHRPVPESPQSQQQPWFYSSPNSQQSSKRCCSSWVWPVGDSSLTSSGQARKVLFPIHLGNQCKLTMLSTPETTLPPRNSLTVSNNVASPKTWKYQRRKLLNLEKEKGQGLLGFGRQNGSEKMRSQEVG